MNLDCAVDNLPSDSIQGDRDCAGLWWSWWSRWSTLKPRRRDLKCTLREPEDRRNKPVSLAMANDRAQIPISKALRRRAGGRAFPTLETWATVMAPNRTSHIR